MTAPDPDAEHRAAQLRRELIGIATMLVGAVLVIVCAWLLWGVRGFWLVGLAGGVFLIVAGARSTMGVDPEPDPRSLAARRGSSA